MKWILPILLIFQVHAASQLWPIVEPQNTGVKLDKWKAFIDFTFSKNEGHSTNALFVIHEGKLIHHSTANGFKKGQPHRQWSISKSISSALIGMAIQQKIITLKTPVNKFYKLHKEARFSPRLEDLLGMSSGFDWNEGYEGNPLQSNVIAMLYTTGYNDMATYTAAQPMKADPGEVFYYSSGETNLMMGMLKKSMGLNDYENYPWTQLFEPLNIKSATWEKDQAGVFVGSSYLFMAPEDLAKIGYLYLKKGHFMGKQLITPEWVTYSTQLTSGLKKYKAKKGERVETYGAQWWLNQNLPGQPNTKKYEALPDDAFMAQGHHGQILLILPSKSLVLVRNASDKDGRLDRNRFYSLLMEALP